MKKPLLTLRVVVVEFDSLISMIEKFGDRQKYSNISSEVIRLFTAGYLNECSVQFTKY